MRGEAWAECLGVAILVLALFALAVIATGAIVWWAWGYVAVPVFGAPPLSFWQAVVGTLGLQALLGIGQIVNAASNHKREE